MGGKTVAPVLKMGDSETDIQALTHTVVCAEGGKGRVGR